MTESSGEAAFTPGSRGESLFTVAARVPGPVRDDFAALAKRQGTTPSALLRRLVERHLAGASDGDEQGEVESAVRAELIERLGDVEGARAATALNLARRMDRVPTSGAANAAQLRQLLAELVPVARSGEFDPLVMIRLLALLKKHGFTVANAAGRPFTLHADWGPEFEGLMR